MRTLSRRSLSGGFAVLSVVIALVIIFILTQQYMGPDSPEGTAYQVGYQERARATLAQASMRQAETQFHMLTDGRRPRDIEETRRVMNELARFGSGGRFFLDHNDELRVTNQVETPRFRERFNQPRFR